MQAVRLDDDTEEALEAEDVSQFLTYRIARLSQLLTAQAAAVLTKASGLTVGQWRILAMLASGQVATSRDICDATKIDPAAVSRTLRTLEQAAHVVLKRDEADRRRLLVSLTPVGRAAYEQALPAMRARRRALVAGLSESELEMAFAIIEKLEEASLQRW